MTGNIYYIQSPNLNSEEIRQANMSLLQQLSEQAGVELKVGELEDLQPDGFNMVFVGGGGCENEFKIRCTQMPQPIILLTCGNNNSLAASMEILSYLRQRDIPSEIIHGSMEDMAQRIQTLARVFAAKQKVKHLRLGRLGRPSDWLISSDVDAVQSELTNGIQILDIPMLELMEEIKKHTYEPNQYTQMVLDAAFSRKDVDLALDIYGGMKRICQKYKLDGITVRCFDLLQPVKNTGCVALAILNAEGIYAGCEGDTPALISMAVLGELTGQPVFMCNPSRIESRKGEIVLAHCTLPLNMPTSFQLMTHYESGLGVAFRGVIPTGDVTVFKCSGLLDRYFASKGQLIENLDEATLCRTQIRIKMDGLDYFTTRSIGNHHCVICGDYLDLVDEFFKYL